jgi:hypothetical protein
LPSGDIAKSSNTTSFLTLIVGSTVITVIDFETRVVDTVGSTITENVPELQAVNKNNMDRKLLYWLFII